MISPFRTFVILCGFAVTAFGADVPVTVVVDTAKPGLTIPQDFLGISYEKTALLESHFMPGNTVFVSLHRNLGQGILRLGGNKVELTRWQAATNPASLDKRADRSAVIGPDTLDELYAFLKAIDWKCLHGLNLAGNQPRASAGEAAYALKIGAGSVLAFEVGNEPNLYSDHKLRQQGYDCATYLTEASAAIDVIRGQNPGVMLAGPATAFRNDHWFEDAVAGLKGRLAIATSHSYALSGGSTNPKSNKFPDAANLLLPDTIARAMAMVDAHRLAAKAAGMRYRLAECNSVSNGGRAGVSDTFVAALWATDFLFSVAEHGADGMNFHCNFKPDSYSPITWSKADGAYAVNPIYYAMLAFKEAGRGRILPASVTGEANVTVHAALGTDGKLRLLLTNKDLGQEIAAHLSTGRTRGGMARLLAPGADARTGVTYGGSSVGIDGKWAARTTKPVSGSATDIAVRLPPGSAAVVTLD